MEKRKLGNSEIYASAVTFGAWAIGGWMWGGSNKKDALNAIAAAYDHEITSIDTAAVYGFGESESIIGEAVKGKRDKFQIFTKYGLLWDKKIGTAYFETTDNEGKNITLYKFAGKESVIMECENSLKRLKTDYIDLYQIHWPDPLTPIEETLEAISILIKQGKIRAAGVSNCSREQLTEAMDFLEITTNQVPYSMLRRNIETDLVPYCIDKNCSILAYSPLQRGLLTGKFNPKTNFKKGDSRPQTPYYSEENILKTNKFLEEINPIAKANNVSLAQLVISWTLEQAGITIALVGARDPLQVKENAGGMNLKLTREEIETISLKLNNLNLELT